MWDGLGLGSRRCCCVGLRGVDATVAINKTNRNTSYVQITFSIGNILPVGRKRRRGWKVEERENVLLRHGGGRLGVEAEVLGRQ